MMILLSKCLRPHLYLSKLIRGPKLSSRGLRQAKQERRGGMNLAPGHYLEETTERSNISGLFKSSFFAFGFCSFCFSTAAMCHYENSKSKSDTLLNWAVSQWNELEGWEQKQGNFRKHMNRWWNSISEGQKAFWPICFLNILVFGAWKLPQLQATMLRYFCSNPAARVICWPMFLSTFSHYSVVHMAINMYVLHSFSSSACHKLGKEQFLALYASGGVVSTLSSYIFKVIKGCPGPSLGASGAIMTLLGFVCSTYPNAQLGIVFIPNFHFSAENAIKAIMCFDALGIVLGWRVFDHAAHLGGAIVGLLYAYFGQKYIWEKRDIVLKQWCRLKSD